MLFAVQGAKKLPENNNLRKIHSQFEQHNPGEQHTGRQRSDFAEPYAIGFPKSNVSHETIECLPNVQGICRMKNRLDYLCGAQKRKVF